jgi:hypothetical protein
MVIVLFSQSCCCTLAKPWLHLRRVSGRIRLAAPVVVVPSLIVEGKTRALLQDSDLSLAQKKPAAEAVRNKSCFRKGKKRSNLAPSQKLNSCRYIWYFTLHTT